MIEQVATVMAVDGEFAWIEPRSNHTCHACSVGKGCAVASLRRLLVRTHPRLRIGNSVGARVGDEVIVGVAESALLLGALSVYLVPILMMLAAAIAGRMLADQAEVPGPEGLPVIFALAGFAGGLYWARWVTRRHRSRRRYQLVVVRRIN